MLFKTIMQKKYEMYIDVRELMDPKRMTESLVILHDLIFHIS